jgi:hypothetical protein
VTTSNLEHRIFPSFVSSYTLPTKEKRLEQSDKQEDQADRNETGHREPPMTNVYDGGKLVTS